MAGPQSKGKCGFCGGEFAKGGMSRHLQTCAQRKAAQAVAGPKAKELDLLHLAVEGRDRPMYWMHLEMPATTTLTTLDGFLRETWLECCGHLSAFSLGPDRYESPGAGGDWSDGVPMCGVKLSQIVQPGDKFLHEYDFGTTTELLLRVVDAYAAPFKGKDIRILAQNDPPDLRCDECGSPATQICAECQYEDKGLLCATHAEDHECGEEMLLPVVNSPRMGMCGYTG